jgi:hypothetical protein
MHMRSLNIGETVTHHKTFQTQYVVNKVNQWTPLLSDTHTNFLLIETLPRHVCNCVRNPTQVFDFPQP